MKKIILVMAAIAALCTSCDPKANTALEWDVTATAVANGNVAFGTPVGIATLNGDASVKFVTDTTANLAAAPAFESVLASPAEYNKKLVAFAKRVADESESSWRVISAEGFYQIDVVGWVIEPTTGLALAINFHFPKQPNDAELPQDEVVAPKEEVTE